MILSRRVFGIVGISLGVLALVGGALIAVNGPRSGRTTSAQFRDQITALEKERETLRARRAELMIRDQRMKNMPDTPVRVGVPTTLARDLILKVVAGFADQVSIELKHLKATKTGTIKRVVTLGHYSLLINIDEVSGRLKPGSARVTFGGDAVALSVPVTIVSGSGRATVHFAWDGQSLGGAVCGDMDVTRVVRGSVMPQTYQLSGSLALASADTRFIITPKIPPMRIHLRIEPSDASWAAAQKVLDDRTGACGFVLDRVDVMGEVHKVIDRGFDVRLPLDRIKPVAFPVTVEPEIMVRGRRVALEVSVGSLSMSEHAIWLGVNVSVGSRAKVK